MVWKVFLLLAGPGGILFLSGPPLIAGGLLLLFRVLWKRAWPHRLRVWVGWAILVALLAAIFPFPVPHTQILRAGVSLLWIEVILSWMGPEERFLLIERLPYPVNGVIWIALRESFLILEHLQWTWRAWRLSALQISPAQHARVLARILDLLDARTAALTHALKLRGTSWFR